ncbi:hypothetical protein BDN72DRAFT_840287 [Pluteus cervinus]|uniref:Uncharacterized protein n=1 Tax=Pluteus cervinus TaxID=181527 RepID=A0ACD3AW36_9AGAR|nr:hypothetical protein BDN72DRAFT_840287 [Pluteus cervinus]
MKAFFQGNQRPVENKALEEYVDTNAFELYTNKESIIKEDADLLVLSQRATEGITLKMRVVVHHRTRPNLRSYLNKEIVVSPSYEKPTVKREEHLELMKNIHIKEMVRRLN